MKMVLSEEKVKQLWSNEIFLSLIAGCKNVLVEVDVDRTAKHLVAIPTNIDFVDYGIELGEDMTRELVKIVDMVALPESSEE